MAARIFECHTHPLVLCVSVFEQLFIKPRRLAKRLFRERGNIFKYLSLKRGITLCMIKKHALRLVRKIALVHKTQQRGCTNAAKDTLLRNKPRSKAAKIFLIVAAIRASEILKNTAKEICGMCSSDRYRAIGVAPVRA